MIRSYASQEWADRMLAVIALTALASSASAQGYFTQSRNIYDANHQELQIRGINHFGFNTPILQPQYLWAMGWKEQIAQIKALGFNAIRLPFAPDALYVATPVDELSYIDAGLNPELIGQTPLQVLDLWMAEANRQGIYVLLDFHSVSKVLQYPTWFVSNPADFDLVYNNQAYTKDHWIRDLAFVARRYAHLGHFLGIDIYNEPHGNVRWSAGDPNVTDPAYYWKAAAELASAAVLAANPNLLIFVQGVSANHDGIENSSIAMNWGENLQPQAYQPLNIPTHKLVLSPHTYGPDVYAKSSFSASDFPENLPASWDTLFGQFTQEYAVVPGEWGGRYGQGPTGTADVSWQNAFADYLIGKDMLSSFYWCYTPNSGDTGGILDDNLNLRADKLALLQTVWGTGAPATDVPTVSPQPPSDALTSIFDDTVNAEWALSSWSATAAVQSAVVQSGSSAVRVDATTWGGASFDSRDANWNWVDQSATAYSHLSFDVSAGPDVGSAINSLEVSLALGWGLAVKVSDFVNSFAPGAWYHVEIPLSDINPNGTAFRKIQFQNNSTSQLSFYVDNVALTPTGTSPTPTPAPPPDEPAGTQLQSCSGIMPLGDSITLGVNGGYRNDLYSGLQQDNCGVSYVGTQFDQWTRVADKFHEGHPGVTISGVADSAGTWVSSAQPNIIVLMIGTNDIAWWTAETAAQIGARHDALIEQLLTVRPGVWILVASIPPQASAIVQPNNIDRALLAQQFNAVVRNNVVARAAMGQQVRFVDVNAVLTTADLYDGIHPTEAAHAKIAQAVLDALRVVLDPASVVEPTSPQAVLSPPAAPGTGQQFIDSFTPKSGRVGTVVTIPGSGFTGSDRAWVGASHNAAINVIS